MRIFIPSSGRAHKQTTIESLPKSVIEDYDVTLVVPPDELEEYRAAVGGGIVIEAPTIPKGIGPTRQWCVENTGHTGKVLMLDDDLVFATRREDDPTKFMDATDEEIVRMLDDVELKLNYFASVGVATREGGNRNIMQYDYDTRLLRALAYRTDILQEHNIRFDEIQVMEDFYVSLQLLTRGYRNCKINHMVQNQNGSGLVGGCSQYRDWQTQANAAYTMKDLFPNFVRVAKKVTKEKWCADEEGYRTDVTIYWKKALKSAGGEAYVRPKR